jgi:hypothetical protein
MMFSKTAGNVSLVASVAMAACSSDSGEPEPRGPYSVECKQDGVNPIADASGTFSITGPDMIPAPFVLGAQLHNTGTLEINSCIPSGPSSVLDALNFDISLILFDLDDQAIDLEVDNQSVYALRGLVSDWQDITGWADGETFVHFVDGTGSFSEVDKQGRLVGTIAVRETDPPGVAMTINVDLTW